MNKYKLSSIDKLHFLLFLISFVFLSFVAFSMSGCSSTSGVYIPSLGMTQAQTLAWRSTSPF